MKRHLLRFVYCSLGLSLAAVVLRALVSPPPDADRSALDRERPHCQVLFVGPSYVNSQVHTAIVDEEALRLGRPLRSCKFAKMHLKGFEQYLELQQILAQSWPKLELVLFDITLGGDSGYRADNRFKPRVIRFHLPEIFAWYYQFWGEQRPEGGHVRRLFDHGLHVLARALHVGVGAEHLSELVSKPAAVHVQLPNPTSAPKKKKMPSRDESRQVARLLKKRASLAKKSPQLSPTKRAFLLHEYQLFSQHGVTAEALLAPTWSPNSPGYGKFGTAGPVVHDFADPRKYPSLYKLGSHTRDGHLTPEATREYSRLLARLIVERLRKQP